jgi:mannose-6-phosphate isomerase-like protein (cupin superfamily)
MRSWIAQSKEKYAMTVSDHNIQAREVWREGVETQMRVSALMGSHQLCIFEQWCKPGHGAPIHFHAVEEVLEVIDGVAEIQFGEKTVIATANHSVLISAGVKHGFRNIADRVLRVRATIAAPIFEASYEDKREQARRWVP